MKCPECNKELNLKLKHCSNCGFPIDELIKKDYEKEEIKNKIEKDIEIKKDNKIVKEENFIKEKIKQFNYKNEFIKSAIFTFIVIILFLFIPSIESRYNGLLTLSAILKWCLTNYIDISYSLANVFIIVIIALLLLGMLLSTFKKKICTVLSVIGYILFELFLMIFGFLLIVTERYPTIFYYLLLLIILGWIIYLIARKKDKKEIKKGNDYLSELKELKTLLDNGTITETEFKKLKNKIIEKE